MTEKTHQDPERVHRKVQEAYTEALKAARASEASCCGPAEACCVPPEGVAAKTAGYDAATLGEFAEASASSFACGNPLAFAEVQEGETVLDLGSGAGFDLLIAARKVGDRGLVIGVDMTDAMIEAARENAAKAGADNVDVRKGTIEELPVDDASVDWVISNCVINLSPEKDRVFAEIARVLKPGGRFSISDIVAEELPESLRAHAAVYSACIGGAIPEEDYVGGLEKAGLAEVEVTERYVYARDQLETMIGAALRDTGESAENVDAMLDAMTGKVWSAKVRGRR